MWFVYCLKTETKEGRKKGKEVGGKVKGDKEGRKQVRDSGGTFDKFVFLKIVLRIFNMRSHLTNR